MCAWSRTAPSPAENTDRLVTAAVGVATIVPFLWRRSKWSASSAAIGSMLLYRAAVGQPGLYRKLGATSRAPNAGTSVEAFLTIGKSAEDLHALWRNPQTLPAISRDVATITPVDNDRARWVLPLPAGLHAEWETAVVDEEVGKSLHWQASGSPRHEGWLRLRPAPQGRGTEVALRFVFAPADSVSGTLLQPVQGLLKPVLKAAARKLLRNFKSFAETGEVPTLDGNTSARAQETPAKGDLV